MDKKKTYDVTQHKKAPEAPPKGGAERAKSSTQSSDKKRRKLDGDMMVTDEDGHSMKLSEWLPSIDDGESVKVHCPISPQSHSNGDATPSCTMQRNGDYLNLKCFGCDSTASYTTKKESKMKKGDEVEYTVPAFNKEEALKSVKKDLKNLDEILGEMIKYLPKLEKKLKDEK